MADFDKAYKILIKNEGGYANDQDDLGGETYKGVARNYHPSWEGWIMVDLMKQKRGFPANLDNDLEFQKSVNSFYRVNFWHKVRGDSIVNQQIAMSIFDFAVNAGPITSSRLAQLACKAKADGVIGEKTLKKLNDIDPELFSLRLFALKCIRRADSCKKRPVNKKYLLGWLSRDLEGL